MTQISEDENIRDLCVINGASAAHKLVRVKNNSQLWRTRGHEMIARERGVTSLFPQLIYAILLILLSNFLTRLNAAYVIVIHPHRAQSCIPALPHNRYPSLRCVS